MRILPENISDDQARLILAVLNWMLVVEVITALLFLDLPQTSREIIIALGGTVVGAWVSSNNYYNKTNVDNDRRKDKVIEHLASTTANQAGNGANAIPVEPGEHVTVVATNDGTDPETRAAKPAKPTHKR